MPHYCSFHPLLPAHYKCENCKSDLCQSCMPEPGLSLHSLRCASCSARLVPHSSASSETPLWHYSGAILKQPLLGHSGWFLLAMLVIFTAGALVNFPLYIGLIIAAAFAVVHGSQLSSFLACNAGRRRATPALKRLFKLGDYRKTLPMLVVWTASVSVCVLLQTSQQYFILVFVSSLLTLVVPVLTVMQALGDEPSELLNLNRFVQVGSRLGNNYMALVCWGLLIFFSGLASLDGLQRYAPTILEGALAPVLLAYLILVWQSMIGFSARSQLGTSDVAAETRHAPLRSSIEERRLGMALREGKYEQVVSLLEGDFYRHGMQDYRLEQLYKLSLVWDGDNLQQKYGAMFMAMLLRRGRDEEALNLLQSQRQKNADYRVADALLCLELVRTCERERKQKLLLWLVQDAHWRFDKSQDLVAQMYRSAAKVLHKHFKQHAKALAYMKKAAQACEKHEASVAEKQLSS